MNLQKIAQLGRKAAMTKYAANPWAQGNVSNQPFQPTSTNVDPRTLNRPSGLDVTKQDPSNLPQMAPIPSGGGHTSKPQTWGNAARNAASAMPLNRFGNPLVAANEVYSAAKKLGPKPMISYMSDKSPFGLPAMNEFIGRTVANKGGVEYQAPPKSTWDLMKQLAPHYENLQQQHRRGPLSTSPQNFGGLRT